MAIFKINKNKNFTTMSNFHLQDENLSLRAKGLLCIMFSLPEDWDYSVKGLVNICKESTDIIRGTLQELEKFNYLVRTKIQKPNGTFNYVYDIYEQPHRDLPYMDLPYMDLPHTVEPHTEKRHANKYTNILNTNEQNTNILNTNIILRENIKRENITLLDDEVKEILNYWNSKNIIVHKTFPDSLLKQIVDKIKIYGKDNILSAIDHYSTILKDNTYFLKYKWTLETFLKQKNCLPDFLDDGNKWLNYINSTSGNKYQEQQLMSNIDLSDMLDYKKNKGDGK